jgi:hypothetical protein
MQATDLGRGTWVVCAKVKQAKTNRRIYIKAKNPGMALKKAYKQFDRS